jgi:hypothetical protein
MNKEFKKITQGSQTRYVLETSSAGATAAGSVATVSMPIGKVHKRTKEDHSTVGSNGKPYGASSYDTAASSHIQPGKGMDMELPENGEYDDEVGMAENNLITMGRDIVALMKLMKPGDNLPEWCQEKIAVAKSMLDTVSDYMRSESELKDVSEAKKKTLKNTNPCWKGYHPVGTKEKKGRTVPNCVPNAKKNESQELKQLTGVVAPVVQKQTASKLQETQFKSKQDLINHFVKQGKSAAAGAAAWERGYRGSSKKKVKINPSKGKEDWMTRWERYRDSNESFSNRENIWSSILNILHKNPDEDPMESLTLLMQRHKIDFEALEKIVLDHGYNGIYDLQQSLHDMAEASSPAQQAAIAINMKKHHKTPHNQSEESKTSTANNMSGEKMKEQDDDDDYFTGISRDVYSMSHGGDEYSPRQDPLARFGGPGGDAGGATHSLGQIVKHEEEPVVARIYFDTDKVEAKPRIAANNGMKKDERGWYYPVKGRLRSRENKMLITYLNDQFGWTGSKPVPEPDKSKQTEPDKTEPETSEPSEKDSYTENLETKLTSLVN